MSGTCNIYTSQHIEYGQEYMVDPCPKGKPGCMGWCLVHRCSNCGYPAPRWYFDCHHGVCINCAIGGSRGSPIPVRGLKGDVIYIDEVHEAHAKGDFSRCLECKGALRPLRKTRVGKDGTEYVDWASREYHVKCWKVLNDIS